MYNLDHHSHSIVELELFTDKTKIDEDKWTYVNQQEFLDIIVVPFLEACLTPSLNRDTLERAINALNFGDFKLGIPTLEQTVAHLHRVFSRLSLGRHEGYGISECLKC